MEKTKDFFSALYFVRWRGEDFFFFLIKNKTTKTPKQIKMLNNNISKTKQNPQTKKHLIKLSTIPKVEKNLIKIWVGES